MGHIAKRKQAIREAKALLLQNVGMDALPQAGGMILPAVGIDLIHVERAKAMLEAAGFSSQQAASFVAGVISQVKDKMERVVDDYLGKQNLQ